ncbi:hypothetical protein [Paenibacillus sp. J2TS4]|uniref:hypothetical protein n=1 Tax=Paenibacillus sp. J2TS4 TaxID=2807194 RepID=UPI001B162802|nr:hypothetical protein [Paenibacillus sp. J2TS4]GIP33564.1 hypothetical protein J2TS4_27740 [Paenibacillus sp. J2TS4]
MNSRTQQLIDFTKAKFGLDNYYLQRHRFDREITPANETVYTLSMEWFPNHAAGQEEEDLNPEGTAVIEIEVNRPKVKSVIFVMGKTYAQNGIVFPNRNTQEIIQWVEAETGLTYGKQFQLRKEEEGELQFAECFEGIAVSPSGFIEVKWNPQGQLTSFSVYGQFPFPKSVKQEIYTLSLDKAEPLAKEQFKLVNFPSYEQNQWVPVYAVEEIFVTNDGTSTLPFEFIVNTQSSVRMDQTLVWDKPIERSQTAFEGKEIQWLEEITAEQAFANEPSPDSLPITEEEREACATAVKDFLSRELPDDTGQWTLKSLHREKGRIHATLRAAQQNTCVFQRKLTVLLDADTLQVHNVIDNQPMLDMFNSFEEPEEIKISGEQAYAKLKSFFELTPYYVYDAQQNQYSLCGKFDCNYGAHAVSGEIVSLNEL